MIQRIQSVWLFLAALLNAGVFFFDFYHAHTMVNGVDTIQHLRVNDHFPSLLIALVITLLPFIAIFLFSNRKRQRMMTAFSILAVMSFISMVLMRVNQFTDKTVPAPTDGTYWIAAVLPVISIIFLILAIRGINKDQKLIKSLDRLR